MSFQVLKYDAIKAILEAEESDNINLAYNMLQSILHATRREIKNNCYSKYYIISAHDKKHFKCLSNNSIIEF